MSDDKNAKQDQSHGKTLEEVQKREEMCLHATGSFCNATGKGLQLEEKPAHEILDEIRNREGSGFLATGEGMDQNKQNDEKQ
ncbi:hypothetical protein AB6A40_008360 [Gnathostoma spinigerum]|uniref:Uncharacterized protein n=1 Tax=Gnathostoma spinigerum TaxID=75299 RepID=A0ABD6EP92_9BILA